MSEGNIVAAGPSVNETRVCPKCGSTKPIADFTSSTGRVNYWCRPCKRRANREWAKSEKGRAAHRRQRQKYATLPPELSARKRWLASERGRDSKARCRKKYAEKLKASPAGLKQLMARRIANNRKNAGKLVPECCVDCGASEGVQMHHPDYDKPLDVLWLCQDCHNKRHGILRLVK